RFIERSFFGWTTLGLVIPFALGWLISGRFTGALTGLLWGGLVRVFLLNHVTWSINSVCHFFGRRRFATDDESRNVFWLALPSFGEAWHHNHPRLPDLGVPRAAPLGARPQRVRHPRAGAPRPRVERRPGATAAPGGEGGRSGVCVARD